MSGLLYALSAGVINGVAPFVFKAQGPQPDRQMGLQLLAAVTRTLLSGLLMLALARHAGSWRFLLLAVGTGLGNMVNVLAYFSVVVHRGPLSVSWSVVWMGTVVLAIAGWTVLDEPIYLLQPIGLLCFVGCLALMALATWRTNRASGAVRAIQKGYWFWLIVALLAGAAAGFCMRLRDLLPSGERGDDLVYLAVGYAANLVVIWLFFRLTGTPTARDARTHRWAWVFGGLQFCILLLVLRGVSAVGLSMFFPVLAGVAIFFGVMLALIGGERPHRLAYLGAALAVASVALINLKGPLLEW